MGLNINLFVHGIPMGQAIWGAQGDDQRYCASFYGPSWDAPELMKVEAKNLGGSPCCYYTFVKGQNISDCNGRQGAYFALTLRFNAYYADFQNIYNILKAACDKLCLGLCLQEAGGQTRFKVADFQSIDKQLKDMEKRIIDYIGQFSVGEDIASFQGFPMNSTAAAPKANLHECSRPVAIECIRKAGKLIVSPWYLPVSAAKKVDQMEKDKQAAIQKAQQDIQLQRRQCEAQLTAARQQAASQEATLKSQHSEALNRCTAEWQQKVDELKRQYADTDKKIAEARKKAQADAQKDIQQCKDRCADDKKKLEREVDRLKGDLKEKDRELKELRKSQLKPDPTGAEPSPVVGTQYPIGGAGSPKGHGGARRAGFLNSKRIIVIIASAVALLVVALLGFLVCSVKGVGKEVETLQDQISRRETLVTTISSQSHEARTDSVGSSTDTTPSDSTSKK